MVAKLWCHKLYAVFLDHPVGFIYLMNIPIIIL